MILRQYLHTEPAVGASYLLGCGGKASGAVVDPMGPVAPYLEDAERLGLKLRYVIDTHVHADHRSSALELARAAGARYVLHESVAAKFDFHPVSDGDRLELGNVGLTFWHTPGHTPEHLCVLVTDRTRSDEPWMVLTGHTLMVGDLGRTELAGSAEEGARDLFRSARRLKGLPDHLEVLPGAFLGSVCGRGLSGKAWSTIGFERRFNRAFRVEDEAEFVALMLRDIPPRPEGFEQVRAHNLEG
ncbi:MBL fold metallo-hydrolase [Calidithermus chliarophilus]|uniref:MBL fold metallo-hydrolase n=1 Tax=Calidithermus chliarophilus TaxID=52023 RepID=UPI00041471AE|nr:MBL fold metallo-hydrolase [Calidithermus chliarophilus]